jgi:hypothetical protein
MKLSRRGKRTKCAKRTKRFKLKRNTKKQFRQYKRKNTHRKHSRKLRKNKRVMRGGLVDVVYEKKNVELEYTTSDDSLMNRARGFFNKLQRGTFTASLSFDGGVLNINNENSVFKKEYTITSDRKEKTHYSEIFASPNHTNNEGIYRFTLTMSKEKKTFKVQFTLTVRRYRVYLDTRKVMRIRLKNGMLAYSTEDNDLINWETKFNLGELLSYDFTYRDVNNKKDTSEKTILDVQTVDDKQVNEVENISIKSNDDKTYTFPFPSSPNYDNNFRFFWRVLDSCKEKVLQLMKKEISEIKPNFTVNTSVNEYPSRIIQPPTGTYTPEPKGDLSPRDPVSIHDEQQQQQHPTELE